MTQDRCTGKRPAVMGNHSLRPAYGNTAPRNLPLEHPTRRRPCCRPRKPRRKSPQPSRRAKHRHPTRRLPASSSRPVRRLQNPRPSPSRRSIPNRCRSRPPRRDLRRARPDRETPKRPRTRPRGRLHRGRPIECATASWLGDLHHRAAGLVRPVHACSVDGDAPGLALPEARMDGLLLQPPIAHFITVPSPLFVQ